MHNKYTCTTGEGHQYSPVCSLEGMQLRSCDIVDQLNGLVAEVERLQTEVGAAWDELQHYGTDSCCELADDDESAEDVTIDTGIQQLGEVAYQWRQDADDAKDEVERLQAEQKEIARILHCLDAESGISTPSNLPNLIRDKVAEVKRLQASLLKCHRYACTKDNCVLDGGPEHEMAFEAAAAGGNDETK